jgi:hypothetical protein
MSVFEIVISRSRRGDKQAFREQGAKVLFGWRSPFRAFSRMRRLPAKFQLHGLCRSIAMASDISDSWPSRV